LLSDRRTTLRTIAATLMLSALALTGTAPGLAGAATTPPEPPRPTAHFSMTYPGETMLGVSNDGSTTLMNSGSFFYLRFGLTASEGLPSLPIIGDVFPVLPPPTPVSFKLQALQAAFSWRVQAERTAALSGDGKTVYTAGTSTPQSGQKLVFVNRATAMNSWVGTVNPTSNSFRLSVPASAQVSLQTNDDGSFAIARVAVNQQPTEFYLVTVQGLSRFVPTWQPSPGTQAGAISIAVSEVTLAGSSAVVRGTVSSPVPWLAAGLPSSANPVAAVVNLASGTTTRLFDPGTINCPTAAGATRACITSTTNRTQRTDTIAVENLVTGGVVRHQMPPMHRSQPAPTICAASDNRTILTTPMLDPRTGTKSGYLVASMQITARPGTAASSTSPALTTPLMVSFNPVSATCGAMSTSGRAATVALKDMRARPVLTLNTVTIAS